MPKKTGTLYGIGVGPGDPELITLKAVRILGRVGIVFAAASSKNSHSLALAIAREHIPETTPVEVLHFPMTRDPSETHPAWEKNAARIAAELDAGRDAAFLTLGDSLTYSTFGYLIARVKACAPSARVETVPGITSYQAAASRLGTPLVEGEGSLLILSGAAGGDRLRQVAPKPETVVFLKAYRNLEDICNALEDCGEYPYCAAVKHCGQPDEAVVDSLDELCRQKPDYWTLIIAKKRRADEPSE
jgi:precorrin-2/cobalt-factor-2 C20-methyltransferase